MASSWAGMPRANSTSIRNYFRKSTTMHSTVGHLIDAKLFMSLRNEFAGARRRVARSSGRSYGADRIPNDAFSTRGIGEVFEPTAGFRLSREMCLCRDNFSTRRTLALNKLIIRARRLARIRGEHDARRVVPSVAELRRALVDLPPQFWSAY